MQSWLKDEAYRLWLARVASDPTMARCTLCGENFDVGNMDEPALTSHMKSAKHQQMVKLRSENRVASFVIGPSVSSVQAASTSVAATTTAPSTDTV